MNCPYKSKFIDWHIGGILCIILNSNEDTSFVSFSHPEKDYQTAF